MKLLILFVFSIAAFAQGTLSLVSSGVAPTAGYAPGSTVVLNVQKSGNASTTGLQFDLAYPGSASATVLTGPAVTAGSKNLVCSAASPIRCLLVGFANTTVIPDGVVATVSVVLASSISTSPVVISLSNPVEADGQGNGLTVTVGNPTVSLLIRSACDVNGDGSVSSADTSAVVSQAITKISSAATDLNSDSKTDVLDAQIASTGATGPTFACLAH